MPANEKQRYVMTSDLRRYIAEYTIANFLRYPIRRRVTYASALESALTALVRVTSVILKQFEKIARCYIGMVPASVAQLDAPSDWRPGGRGFNPRRGRQHSFVEIDHEIFSTVILSLPLIQEGQLSVSGERMCTVLVNPLED